MSKIIKYHEPRTYKGVVVDGGDGEDANHDA